MGALAAPRVSGETQPGRFGYRERRNWTPCFHPCAAVAMAGKNGRKARTCSKRSVRTVFRKASQAQTMFFRPQYQYLVDRRPFPQVQAAGTKRRIPRSMLAGKQPTCNTSADKRGGIAQLL